MTLQTIDITPDVSLIKKAGEVNYNIPQAIAELVDNSIDARLLGRKLTVEVTLGQKEGQKYVRVVDDGRGMTEQEAEKALVMAHSKKPQGQIGEFGLGMKTACSFLGARFEVVTASKEAKRATRLVYDEEEFIHSGKWQLRMEYVDKPFEQGTEITVLNLKVNLYPGVKDVVVDSFSKLFKHFVAAGEVEIIVNGDQIVPYVPETLKDYDTEIAFEVNGKVVKGWASLSPRVSGRGFYGFDLVRANRVMIRHAKLGFKPGFGTAFIVGELHLDDFPVVNNKTDFRRDTDDWQQMEAQLKQLLVDLVRASRQRANPGKQTKKDQAEVKEFVDDVKDALKDQDLQQDLDRRALDAALADEFSTGPLPFSVPDRDGGTKAGGEGNGEETTKTERRQQLSLIEDQRLKRVKTQLRSIVIEHEVASLGRDGLYKIWEIAGVGSRKKLLVTTNRDHPIYLAMEGSFMVWIKHNIVEAVAEFFTEELGKTEGMLRVKSDILKHVGKMNLEFIEDPEAAGVVESE